MLNCTSQFSDFNLRLLTPKPVRAAADLRDWKLMSLCPVDADGNVSIGGAQLLIESAVGADPQVILCDFHLENKRHI